MKIDASNHINMQVEDKYICVWKETKARYT